MRNRYLFCAMAASLALASCSNEEFGYDENVVSKGDMVSVKGLNMVFTKADAQTRAQWDEVEVDKETKLRFYWTGAEDAIGMVYTGQGGTTGVTNYKFAADSLKFDEAQVGLVVSPAADKSISMFYKIAESYSDITLGTTAGFENYQKKSGVDAVDFGKSVTAKFETVNDEILKGYYVAYYPFNPEYRNAGEQIPVESVKEITVKATSAEGIVAANLAEVGKHTFSYSTPAAVEAGKQVTEFALKNLSSALRITIANEGELTSAKKLKSVVLRTKGKDAFVVKGKLNNPSAAPSANVIAVDEKEGRTATLFVRYDGDNLLTLEASKKAEDKNSVEVYFPVLPATFAEGGFDVILIGEDNKACVLDAKFTQAGNVTLGAGKRLNLNTTLTKDTKFDQAFVTSAEDLQTAIDNAKGQAAPTTINLLGDIASTDLTMSGVDANDWKGGVTIVASAGSKLILTNPAINIRNDDDATKNTWLTINAPVAIKGGSIAGSVALNGETTIEGTLTIGKANSEKDFYAGQLSIGGKTTILAGAKVTARYSKGVTVEKNGELIIAKSDKQGVSDAKFINDNWKYGAQQYKSDLNIKGTMTVNGVLEDGGDTNIDGGKLVVNGQANNRNQLNVKNNGTIEVNGKFTNELALDGDAAEEKLAKNGNVKIETGKLTINAEGEIYNKASLNCMGAFVNNGTFYDYVGSVYGGVPYTSNGAYACYVNSAERLAEAYVRLNRYAKDKFQKIILQANEVAYELDNKAAESVNFENEGNITIGKAKAAAYLINSLKVNEGEVTIASGMKVAGATVATQAVAPIAIGKDGKLTINNNIEVQANGAIVNSGTFNLLDAVTSKDLPANVYCKSADVTKGVWTNYPLVIADGSFWE